MVVPSAQARINPVDRFEDSNCTASGADNPGGRSGVYIKGYLFYGDDNDRHGYYGTCSYLTPVIAVQASYQLKAHFKVPLKDYKPGMLPKTRLSVTYTSNAISKIEKESTWAGNVEVGKASIGAGISHTGKDKIKLLTNKPRTLKFNLASRSANSTAPICTTSKEGTDMVIRCSWTMGLTSLTWTAPEQRTSGGVRTIAAQLTSSLGKQKASYTLLFQDDGDG